MAQALLQGAIGGPRRESPPGTPSGLSPLSSPLRSRRSPANYPRPWACRCSDSAWPMWRDTPSALAWWHASATAPCGVGCMKMPSAPGNIVAGYFRAIRNSRPRPGVSWTCTNGAGKVSRFAPTSTSSPPTRRPASRLGCASIPACPLQLGSRCAWSTSTHVAAPGLTSRPGCASCQGVRPLRSDHRHCALRAPGRSGHAPATVQHSAPGVLGNGQRLVASRPGLGAPPHAGISSIGTGSRPRARELAQPDRNPLLHRAAQGIDPQRLPKPCRRRPAAGKLRARRSGSACSSDRHPCSTCTAGSNTCPKRPGTRRWSGLVSWHWTTTTRQRRPHCCWTSARMMPPRRCCWPSRHAFAATTMVRWCRWRRR